MKSRPPPSHHPEPLEDRIAPANLAFAFELGGGQNQFVDDIAVDPAGNTYVTGRFQGTVDFDPGPGVQSRAALKGDTDGFVAKYDGMGALAWVDIVRESDRNTNPLHLAVSPRGETFLFGEFGSAANGNVSFADRLGPPAFTVGQIGSAANVYVAKIDSSGGFQWAVRYGSLNTAAAASSDIAVDGNGGIYLTGRSIGGAGTGSLSFDAATVNVDAGETDLFVVRMQDELTTPTVTWANDSTSPGVNANVSGLSVATNSAGQVAIRGVPSAPLTFATAPVTVVTQNIFVGSLDNAGAWVWVDQWTGGTDNGANVAVDAAGNVFVLGDFTETVDVDPGAATNTFTSAGSDDFYIVQLNAAGAFVFASQYGNASSNKAGQIAGLDAAGRVYFTGDIGSGRFDVDPSSDSAIVTGTGAILVLGPGGSFVLADQHVTRAKTISDTVVVDADGGLHRAGTFNGSFNAGLDNAKQAVAGKGGTDFFVARYFPGDQVAQDLSPPVLKGAFPSVARAINPPARC